MTDPDDIRLDALDPALVQTVRRCLHAAAHGDFFDDWELSTLMGFERDEIAAIAPVWPRGSEHREADRVAIQNVLNNFLGYPGIRQEKLEAQTGATLDEIRALAKALRARLP